MRTLIIASIALLLFNGTFSQGLAKGNLFGVRKITVTLKPGITMEEFRNFYIARVLPEYEKAWTGLKGYLLQSFKDTSSFAVVWLFKSVNARNRYFTKDDKANDLEKAAYKKVKPVEDELKQKYGTYTIEYKTYDDWIVQ